jgi:hypothetical protein
MLLPSRGFGCNGDYTNKIYVVMSVQISVKTWTIKGDLYINVAPSLYYENKIEICLFLIICQDGNYEAKIWISLIVRTDTSIKSDAVVVVFVW